MLNLLANLKLRHVKDFNTTLVDVKPLCPPPIIIFPFISIQLLLMLNMNDKLSYPFIVYFNTTLVDVKPSTVTP